MAVQKMNCKDKHGGGEPMRELCYHLVRAMGLTEVKAVETEENERIQEILRNDDLEAYK